MQFNGGHKERYFNNYLTSIEGGRNSSLDVHVHKNNTSQENVLFRDTMYQSPRAYQYDLQKHRNSRKPIRYQSPEDVRAEYKQLAQPQEKYSRVIPLQM